uniref:Nuclear pore complex protein NUP98A-like n=1 Tax=Raphanus sativus TaxID=3726 RepID=C4WRG6_RAPSA|nr:hypothetical protein [Raphanus sativus]
MRIGVSEPEQCGCDTCVQHRTLCTQETEPSKEVTGSSVPVSSEPVQRLGSTSDQCSGTHTTPLAPPEPAAQSVDASSTSSSIFSSVSSQPARALCPTGSLPVPLFGCSWPRPCSCTGCSLLGPSIRRSSPFFTASSGSSISSSRQANVTNSFGSAASEPSVSGPMKAPIFTSGSSTASTSSTLPSLVTPSDITRGSVQAPVQANTSKTASDFHPPNVANTGVCAASRTSTNNPFPGFSVDYLPRCPSNLSRPNAPTTTPVPGPSSVLAGGETEQGSRYPRYAPTPDVDGKQIISISASNSHGHKSHEELRWEDYKNGDKAGVGSFPPPDHTPSVFTPPSIPDRPRMRTIDLTNRDTSGFPIGYNTPAAFQSPHEPVGVSSPASGCTACGAASSSSPSSHLGLNSTTNPPSSATSLPGLFFSTYGSFPLLFATPNLAAYGTTPAVQAYPMMFGIPNLAAQGTATPSVQAYPMIFGIPNLAAQGTTATPAFQAYPMIFGIPNVAAQGTTTTTPAAQAYPMMFGIPNLAAQGTTTPAAQPYPTMFGTPSLAAQGTTTAPAVQPYPTMYGTPNFVAQGMTPAAQAYPVNGSSLLPFAAMSLQ